MLKSPLLKYVAGPQTFAYMPPILAGASVGTGMMIWFMGQIAGFGVLPGMLIMLVSCGLSAAAGFKDPHISNILVCRQKFMKKTPGLIATKGKQYVG
jgi:hypothetical protein